MGWDIHSFAERAKHVPCPGTCDGASQHASRSGPPASDRREPSACNKDSSGGASRHDAGSASMPLVFENIVVRYTKCGMERVVPINLSGRMFLQQGTMICIAGPYGEGKSTLLRIIGGAALPDPKVGIAHVPAYLRVLNVPAEPIFFKGT